MLKKQKLATLLIIILSGEIILLPLTTKAEEKTMRVTSTGIKDGQWEKQYGKYGKDFVEGVPSLSVPFAIHNPPEKTVSYAVILKDDDAVAVAGHPWIHWLVSGLDYENVTAGESRSETNAFIQGQNSWGQDYYGGMAPPNAPHRYDLHIYALDFNPELRSGYTYDELHKTIKGHVIEEYTLSAVYPN